MYSSNDGDRGSQIKRQMNILKDPRVVKFGLGSWSRNEIQNNSLTNSKRDEMENTDKNSKMFQSNLGQNDECDYRTKSIIKGIVPMDCSTNLDDKFYSPRLSSCNISTQTDDFSTFLQNKKMTVVFKGKKT